MITIFRYWSLSKLLPIDSIKPVLGQHNCLDSLFTNILYVRHGRVLRILLTVLVGSRANYFFY